MINGMVNEEREAVIQLTLRNIDSEQHTVNAVIDTGFTGYLTLPHSLIDELDLTWLGVEQAILGDGSTQLFDVYMGTILWDNEVCKVEVDAADSTPLIGMGLLQGYKLRLQVIVGGEVTITKLDT